MSQSELSKLIEECYKKLREKTFEKRAESP